jgi:chromosome condensin MukBEF MukE localization factor
MNRIEFLRSQIERIRRFAASLTNIGERERFQQTEAEYRRELDALSSADTTSADTSAPSDAIAAKSEPATAAPSDAIAASNDGDAITSTNDTGPQKTD